MSDDKKAQIVEMYALTGGNMAETARRTGVVYTTARNVLMNWKRDPGTPMLEHEVAESFKSAMIAKARYVLDKITDQDIDNASLVAKAKTVGILADKVVNVAKMQTDKAVEQQVFQLPSAGDVQARITLLQAKLSGMPFLLAALRAGQDGPTLKDRVVELVQEGRALDLDGNDGKLIGFGQLPGDSGLVEQNDMAIGIPGIGAEGLASEGRMGGPEGVGPPPSGGTE